LHDLVAQKIGRRCDEEERRYRYGKSGNADDTPRQGSSEWACAAAPAGAL
jgi:hypothetical protein